MRKVWVIGVLHLKLAFRDRLWWLFIVVLPLALTFLTATAWGGGRDDILLLILDRDGKTASAFLAEELRRREGLEVVMVDDEDAARRAVFDGRAAALVVIPAGFTRALEMGQFPALELFKSRGRFGPTLVERLLRATCDKLTGAAVTSSLLVERGSVRRRDESLNLVLSGWDDLGGIYIRTKAVTPEGGEGGPPSPVEHVSPGFAVMFVLMTTVMGASDILAEKHKGTLQRSMITPTSPWAIATGRFLGIVILGGIQMTLLICFGQFVFGVNWGNSPAALVMVAVALLLAGTGIGLLLASLSQSVAQARTVGTLIVMLTAMLGGTWWPVEVMPPSMQRLAEFTPAYWAMRGFHDVIVRGVGPAEVAPETAVLLAAGICCLFLGSRVFARPS